MADPAVRPRAGERSASNIPHPVGLRVDITSRPGFEVGLPRLEGALASAGARATLMVATGPERAWWRLRPYLRQFGSLPAALRLAREAGLSVSSLASELVLPARPQLEAGAATVLRMIAAGHEAGCLGYDYWKWVIELRRGTPGVPFAVLDQEAALDCFRGTFGRPPVASASPGFLCSEETLRAKEAHALRYGSDCRGTDPFLPVIAGKALTTPQVPVTLPTLSELLSQRAATPTTAFKSLLAQALEEKWPVLRIRAELEGGAFLEAFTKFLGDLNAAGRSVVPLGELLECRLTGNPLPRCTLSYGELEGRPGTVSLQMFEV